MDEFYIPKYLDLPTRILTLTIDEFIGVIITFAIFVFILKMQIIAIGACLLVFFLLKKLKGEKGPYVILHLMYWHLPPILKFKQIPPSYKRRFIG